MKKDVKPLYRKVNTRARNVWHNFGSDSKYDRNTKNGLKKSMKRGVERGLDYTPLFKFLLSKVGQKWDKVYSEAVSRLDKKEPIFWMVKEVDDPSDRSNDQRFFRVENSFYSKLFVDEAGILQKVDPTLSNEDFTPSCSCCTHSFNGKPLMLTYEIHNHRLSQGTAHFQQ
jgi:hypothetical protein